MSQNDTDALTAIRAKLVEQRRAAALAGDAEGVVHVQRDLALIDAAAADEQALGQKEKDEQALARAMRDVPDGSNVDEISLLSDPIRVQS